MALNKRKVLDAARKHAQKGAKSKALKEYNKLLKEDPSDAKLLLEVGDAYRRWGQPDEAISQYGKVAAQYRNVGFDARAVAVFKQILNLDPKHYDAYISLAELYQRMGLDSDAIASLQRAADGYHKEGRKAEALELLRQMAALDPSNTTSRLKVAELLRQEGMEEDALAEYLAVAKELENQPDVVVTVLQRILELRPDHLETLIALARNLISAGELDRAEPPALRALKVSGEPEQHELLMDLYAQAGSEAKLADATRGLAKLYRERGEEDKARELIQRLPAAGVGTQSAATSSARLAVDVSEASEPTLDDGELLEDEPFLALDGNLDLGAPSSGIDTGTSMDPGSGLDEIELDARRQAPSAAKKNQQVALPEGDPDQLLAEASVYLRYGKGEQAIASLRGVIAQDPKHRAALEKLGEAYAEDGQNSEAVEVWLRAAEQIRAEGDAAALEILRDRIAALDPVLAAQIQAIETSPIDSSESTTASVVTGEPETTNTADSGFQLDIDSKDEVGLDQAIGEVAESENGFELEAPDGDSSQEFESDLDVDPIAGDSPEHENDEDSSIELDIEIDPEDLRGEGGEETPGPEIAIAKDESTGSESTPSWDAGHTLSADSALDEEIEEAEFYIAQDMFEEATAILRGVLELVPDHAQALVLLGESLAAGDAGSGSASDPAAALQPADAEATVPLDYDTLDCTTAVEPVANDDTEADIVVDLDLDGDDDTIPVDTYEVDADAIDATEQADSSSDAPIESDLEDCVEVASDATDTEVVAVPKAAQEPLDPTDSFDLGMALAVMLDEDSEVDAHDTSGVLSTVEDTFESVFSDFKKGVSETLEVGDYETHYDLGIAYRGMGLFDDAIGEFRVCLDSPKRGFDSLYLMGLCERDLSRWDDAVNHLEQALALPAIPNERLAGVYFDLSIAQEGSGDGDRARDSVQRVLEIEADFPGAADRLAALESGQSALPDVGEPGERYESFDDLFSTDDDEQASDPIPAETAPTQANESFDDVIAESEAEAEAVEAEPVDQAEATGPSNSKRGGRKKISFV